VRGWERDDLAKVKIDPRGLTGESAGLMLTLAVLDALTPDELVRERRIAGTGTIESDGTVGPVGFVARKALAAEQDGVDLFLVPHEQTAEARAPASTTKIVGVHNLDDAVLYLSGIGCRTGAR
jgi:PDZ domain-containing protein